MSYSFKEHRLGLVVFFVLVLVLAFSSTNANAEERLSEKELDKLLIPHFDNKKDLELLDYGMKEILLKDIEETNATIVDVKKESPSYSSFGNAKSGNSEGNLDSGISIMSQIPTNQLKQFITSSVLSNGEVRVYGYWEWLVKGNAVQDNFGLSISNDFDIVSKSYACRINYRNQTSESWGYLGNCGGDGTAYEIDRYGASWTFSNSLSRYYKGFGSYRVKPRKTSGADNRAIMQYAFITDSSVSIGVGFGPVSISHSAPSTIYKQSTDGTFVYR